MSVFFQSYIHFKISVSHTGPLLFPNCMFSDCVVLMVQQWSWETVSHSFPSCKQTTWLSQLLCLWVSDRLDGGAAHDRDTLAAKSGSREWVLSITAAQTPPKTITTAIMGAYVSKNSVSQALRTKLMKPTNQSWKKAVLIRIGLSSWAVWPHPPLFKLKNTMTRRESRMSLSWPVNFTIKISTWCLFINHVIHCTKKDYWPITSLQK